ncbi:S-adenosyl-L-methionine-dependent methyltransferase [Trinorchestia longiramus]|nr:S-adenosyl-L-methionine-dependent methyltransferase [Trinorchestia longiramus]
MDRFIISGKAECLQKSAKFDQEFIVVKKMSDESSRPQFGGRFLVNPEDVFQHNAWDNVVWGEEQEQKAREAVAKNSEVTYTSEQLQCLEEQAANNWNKFYGVHQNKFFKNRNWLFTEFPELALHLREKLSPEGATSICPAAVVTDKFTGPSTSDDVITSQNSSPSKDAQERLFIDSESRLSEVKLSDGSSHPEPDEANHKTDPMHDGVDSVSSGDDVKFPGETAKFRVLEVGCGVGNTIFPVLETNPEQELFVYGADFSSTAIEIVRTHEDYDQKRCHAFVLDITDTNWSVPFPPGSLDVITCIYVLSAVHPHKHAHVAGQLFQYLKPGGVLLLRDYGRFDLTQLRFKKGKCLADNYYVRGDGTKSYFFTQEEIRDLFVGAGFEEKQNIVDRRLQVNRGKQLTMYRVWVQAKYTKPDVVSKPQL